MADKKKPRHPREHGGMAKIENPDDGTPIRTMVSTKDYLLALTDKCTYQIQMADQIDPERKNPNLPFTTQQKILDHGFESEIVARTLLQGAKFFRSSFLDVDPDAAIKITLAAARELIAMDQLARSFKDREEKAIGDFNAQVQSRSSLVLPTLGDVAGDCKSFVQRADHFSAELLAIVRLYLPDMKGEGWGKMHETVSAKYSDDPGVAEFVLKMLPSFELMRDARNILEHRLAGAKLRDFAAKFDGSVARPEIEISFKKSNYGPAPISEFMAAATASFLNAFEQIITMLSAKEVKPFGQMEIVVGEVPENVRAGWRCRYAFGLIYEGQGFVPMG